MVPSADRSSLPWSAVARCHPQLCLPTHYATLQSGDTPSNWQECICVAQLHAYCLQGACDVETTPGHFWIWGFAEVLGGASTDVTACQAWLCSASMRVLEGSCSAELEIKLGWVGAPPLNVLAAQLLELGKLHAKVRPLQNIGISNCSHHLDKCRTR